MDFIKDLPLSNGFTCIFVVIDRFTKMGHFIPFPKVPSAIDTYTSFMNNIFRLHGLLLKLFLIEAPNSPLKFDLLFVSLFE